ncbi:MAG: hypothetical protein LBU89_14675 [Fibromonadaceae bacterium]|jgi:hypothetical protein|nr:hypothetical protein [Fibromonadaceae bacterium]
MNKFYFTLSDEKQLFKIALGISTLWIVAQIILISCFWGYPQQSDHGAYIAMAQRCFDNGQWYPMAEDIYSTYIHAPGFINYLVLQLHVFGTLDFNAVLNLFLNIAMLFEVYYLGNKFFSKRTGLISVIIFCFLYSNLLIVLGAYTEVPFMFLCLSALCLVFSGKWKYIILASILFALANWIRPLVIIFLFASVVYFVITKTKFYNYIALIIPYILILFVIGTATEKKIGYFIYQSSTSGINLLMTANDRATGTYMHDVGNLITEDIELMTFAEKDSIMKVYALKWIKENPIKYAVLYFKKIPGLYIHDSWSYSSHWANHATSQFLSDAGGASKDMFIKKFLKQALQSIPYYLTLLFFFYGLWISRKDFFTVKSVFLIIFATGTLITCILNVTPRFHYPFMFVVIIYAAYGINTLVEKK